MGDVAVRLGALLSGLGGRRQDERLHSRRSRMRRARRRGRTRAGPAGAADHGIVVGYGMHVQELHGQLQPGRKWTHRSWYAVSDLGAIDRIESALVAAGLTPQQAARAAEVHDMSAHTDDVLMVLYQGAPPAAPAATKK